MVQSRLVGEWFGIQMIPNNLFFRILNVQTKHVTQDHLNTEQTFGWYSNVSDILAFGIQIPTVLSILILVTKFGLRGKIRFYFYSLLTIQTLPHR